MYTKDFKAIDFGKNPICNNNNLNPILPNCDYIFFFCIIFNEAYFNTSGIIDTKLAAEFGNFLGGYVGVLFSMLSTLLLVYTIIDQFIERQKR